MEIMEQLSNKIKLLREVHNYLQEYVANAIDVAQNTYCLIEKGAARLTYDRLVKLAHLYKMDIMDLIRLNEQTFIHSITHSNNNGFFSKEFNINNPPSEEERKSYHVSLELHQAAIARLEKENERLLVLIEKLTGMCKYSSI